MLRLCKIVKSSKERVALSANGSVCGLLGDHAFLAKGGDVGVVLRGEGVDYEWLDHKQTDSLTKRLESALRLLGPQFRVYQLLFKSSRETIPHSTYENPVVKQAVDDRLAYFDKKAGELYSLRICYVVLDEGAMDQASLRTRSLRPVSTPEQGMTALAAMLTSTS